MPRTSLVVAALLLLSEASAQLDPTTGYIKPTPGVPRFDPAAWNAAYKVTFRNMPLRRSPDQASDYHVQSFGCLATGFETQNVSAVTPVGIATSQATNNCFYRNTTSSTYDYWLKQQGLAIEAANCYCYALNVFEGNSCEPGTSKGGRSKKQYESKMTCPALHQALVDDGAVPVTRQQALSGQPKAAGHYIAALARPSNNCVPTARHCTQSDMHFMRKDASGTWSYKAPQNPATDRDLEGQPITDPEAAPLPGHYVVCGYYQVDPMQMPTGTVNPPLPGPLASMRRHEVASAVQGVTADISLSPYNPDTDTVIRPIHQQWNADDLEWERKRGSKEYNEWFAKQKQLVQAPGAGGALQTVGSKAGGGRRLRLN